MKVEGALTLLRQRARPGNLQGMRRFGIATDRALGVSVPEIRAIAKIAGRDHDLALSLWKTGIHEARILAAMVDDPAAVTEGQMEAWVGQFDSWDVCDGCCGTLFDKTKFAYRKAVEWSRRDEEFVKRAGFVLMAELAVHDKTAPDERFQDFFTEIERGASDERNFVKKAVNWALRQIGKRNRSLNARAVKMARKLKGMESTSAKWAGSDALRELTSEAVLAKLRRSS